LFLSERGSYFSLQDKCRRSAVILCNRFSVTYLQREEGARERSHLLLQLIILFDYKLILILKKNPVDLSTS
jgi:hypothetical protein